RWPAGSRTGALWLQPGAARRPGRVRTSGRTAERAALAGDDRLGRGALGEQGPLKAGLAAAPCGVDEGDVAQVALGVAAAEPVRPIAHVAQQLDAASPVALAVGLDALDHRQADDPHRLGV